MAEIKGVNDIQGASGIFTLRRANHGKWITAVEMEGLDIVNKEDFLQRLVNLKLLRKRTVSGAGSEYIISDHGKNFLSTLDDIIRVSRNASH